MCASPQLTRLGTEPRSGARRSEEAAEKEPVVRGTGGLGEAGLGPHTKGDAKRGGRHWQLRGGGSCLWPKAENRGSFILASPPPPPHTMVRNLTLSVLRDPSFPASFRLPPATVSCAPLAPRTRTPNHPCQALGHQACAPLSAQPGNLPALGPQDRGRGDGVGPLPLLGRSHCSAPSHALGLRVSLPLALPSFQTVSVSGLTSCLSPSPISVPSSLSYSCLPPSLTHTHTHITFSPNLCFCLNLFLSDFPEPLP